MENSQNPQRILVVGCCGAGKSYFARQLAEKTGLPLIHLDQHFHQPGWIATETDRWNEVVRELVSQDRWIMDGNYAGSLPIRLARADLVIWVDPGKWLTRWRIVLRTLKYHGRKRPDAAEGCHERFELDFFKYVWNWQRNEQPRLEEILSKTDVPVVYLKSRRAVDGFLEDRKQVKAR